MTKNEQGASPSTQLIPAMLPINMSQKISVDDSGCWVFTGATNSKGYGLIAIDGDGSTRLTHRAAYQLLVGPVPEGRIVYHTCGVRRCCNPHHLVAAEPKQAMLHVKAEGRAVLSTRAAENAAKAHCQRGHEFTAENTARDSRGHRVCRQCKRMKDQEAYARRVAARKNAEK